MKAYFKILGCKMNLVEGERIASALADFGCEITKNISDADLVIVNTCAVTAQAERKSRQAVSGSLRVNPKTEVIVFGCGAKASPEAFRKLGEHVSIFQNPQEVINYLKAVSRKLISGKQAFQRFRTRAYIEIQNGCDNYCTYCIIARLRGKHVSRKAEDIIHDIQKAEEEGAKEVILTGINIGAWGASFSHRHEEAKFHELLVKILKETSIPRIRISSLSPQYISEELIDLWSQENRIQPHLHLSLQSGSTPVLARMRRGYTAEEVDEMLTKLKEAIPDIGISADIIVGFCGETEDEFLETCSLVQKHEFMKLHVFPFSLRKGTAAEKLGDTVSADTKKERTKKLRNISNVLYKKFVQKNTGKVQKVLVEGIKSGSQRGLTGNYIPIRFPKNKDLINKIVRVRIKRI